MALLQDIHDFNNEIDRVELPGKDAPDSEKLTAVIGLLKIIARIAKHFTGPKGDEAIDYILMILGVLPSIIK